MDQLSTRTLQMFALVQKKTVPYSVGEGSEHGLVVGGCASRKGDGFQHFVGELLGCIRNGSSSQAVTY